MSYIAPDLSRITIKDRWDGVKLLCLKRFYPDLEDINTQQNGVYDMTRFLLTTAAVALMGSSVLGQTYETGLQDLQIEGERPLEGYVWYPTDAAEGLTRVHGNAVWEGIMAVPDATPAQGAFPLVVLSHGMFGNAMNQSWLASALAEQGYVVAAISHPGTSTWLRDPDDRRMLWERARDVSRVIDALELDPRVDADRVFVAGHSLGGFTAMLLAGARYDPALFDGFCAEAPEELVCAIFQGWEVAQTPEDREMMAADWSDPRIDGFASFDMGGAQTFSPQSLGAVTVPVLVYGAPVKERDGVDMNGLDLEVQSRALAAAMPEGVVTYLEPETLAHFDFLGTCTENALAILAQEEPGDLFVCVEGRAARRAEQAQIVATVEAFFQAVE